MTEISFYHLQKFKLADALSQLLEKAYDTGHGTIVRVSSKMLMDSLDKALWETPASSFLPHGTKTQENKEKQPVYLTTDDDNPNNAKFLFVLNDAGFNGMDGFERVFYVFDGQDELMVEHAREQWKTMRESGFELKYWQQSETGGWKLKAS